MTLNATFLFECASNNGVSTFPTNTDVTGIGIRVSLYISGLLAFVTAILFPHDLDSYRDAARTSLVTSTSMFVTALYTRYSGLGLSLVDAQIVLTTSGTLSMVYSMTMGDISMGVEWVIAYLYSALAYIFMILVYYDVDHFGGAAYQPGCAANSQFEIAILGCRISATNPGLRIFALLLGGLSFGVFITCLLFEVDDILGKKRKRAAKAKSPNLPITPTRSTDDEEEGVQITKLTALLGLGGTLYLIVTVEQIVRWNGLNTLSIVGQWTFGQTLAVTILGDQVLKLGVKLRQQLRTGEDRTKLKRRLADSWAGWLYWLNWCNRLNVLNVLNILNCLNALRRLTRLTMLNRLYRFNRMNGADRSAMLNRLIGINTIIRRRNPTTTHHPLHSPVGPLPESSAQSFGTPGSLTSL